MKGKSLSFKDKLVAILMKLFIAIALLFPFITTLDSKNTVFILSNFICSILIAVCFFRENIESEHKYFFRIFLTLVVIYNLVFGYYNIYYHHYYIEQVNKTISFVLLLVLIKKIDGGFIVNARIREFLIVCILLTCIASIIYYFLGGDAINIENFQIEFRKQGMFIDKRLTWLFGHKSAYGLMLVLFISVVMRFKALFASSILFWLSLFIILLTIFLSGSTSTFGLVFIPIAAFFLSKYNFRKNVFLTFCLTVGGIIICFLGANYIYNYISETRDITTVGNRTYIYKAAEYYLQMYPQGIGKSFGYFRFTFEVMDIDNLHNIFLNEMLRFSIIVGVIYTVIFIYLALYSIKRYKLWAASVWITCFGLFFMDYSLTTDFLSIFFFLIYILFFYD